MGCVQQDHRDDAPLQSTTNDLRTDGNYINPCFDPSKRPECEKQESFVNRTIHVPGYCDVTVTYTLWKCDDIFTIADLQWRFSSTDPECVDWLGSLQTDCYNSCTLNGTQPPMDPNCINNCIGDAFIQAEIDVHWYILDDYVRRTQEVSQIASCDGSSNGKHFVRVRFFRENCKLVCNTASTSYYSPSDVEIHVCGGGCCEQGATYCVDNDLNLMIKETYNNSDSMLCSDLVNLCENLYQQTTISNCKPATCN